jgi:hypothetical protein
MRTPKREIDRFVSDKEQWILSCIAKQRIQAEQKESFTVNYDSRIAFRGRLYPIIKRDGKLAGFDDEAFYMPQGLPPERIKSVCIQLYKMLAKAYISNRVAVFAAEMGATPSAVKINSATKRWGSCSARGSLNFSWRLIMADDGIIDYVVVHELAHLTELNHSVRFWAIVESVLPDYRERRVKLRELQQRLSSEDWE